MFESMILWIVFAAMTGLAVVMALLPLIRRSTEAKSGGNDLVVYRDQLAEIERDIERGIIGATEGEAARIEISRRLLAAAEVQKTDVRPQSPYLKPIAAFMVLGIPVVALAMYLTLGSPDLEGQPLASRIPDRIEDNNLRALVTRVEQHLRANPEDGQGWDVVAPVYVSMGRIDDAVAAYQSAIRIIGSTPQREADLGEVLVQKAGGMITTAARLSFEKAIASDNPPAKARYYLAQAADQDGDLALAKQRWTQLLKDSPGDAGWLPLVKARLAEIDATLSDEALPGPTAVQVSEARDMAAEDQREMILGMIERLDTRLSEEGGSVEEWLRLIRAFSVVKDKDNAERAFRQAMKSYEGDAAALEQLQSAAGAYGLGG